MAEFVDLHTVIDPMASKVGPLSDLVCFSPPSQSNYAVVTGQSPSSSSINFNLNLSQQQLLSTSMTAELEGVLRVSVTTAALAGAIFAPGTCFRQFPLASASTSIQVQFNQTVASINSGRIMSLLGRCMDYDDTRASDSLGLPDCMVLPADYARAGASLTWRDPSNKAPAVYNTPDYRGSCEFSVALATTPGTCDTEQKLTGIGGTVAPAAGAGAYLIYFKIREPVVAPGLMSPAKSYNSPALANLNNVNITYNFGDLRRLLVCALSTTTTAITGITFETGGNFNLTARLYYQVFNYAPEVFPLMENIEYANLTWQEDDFVSSGAQLQDFMAGTVVSHVIPNVILQTIPDRIIIGVRQSDADRVLNPDFFIPISSINILINGQASVLNSASQYQLYQISRKNGLKDTFANFRLYGAPVILTPNDMGIVMPNAAVGALQNIQLQITVNAGIKLSTTAQGSIFGTGRGAGISTLVVAGANPNTINATAHAVFISPSLLKSRWNNSTFTKGLFTPEQVAMSRASMKTLSIPELEYYNYVSGGLIGGGAAMLGGSLFSWIRDAGRSAYNTAKSVGKDIYNVAREVVPVASDILKFAASQGVPLAAQASQGLQQVRNVTGLGAKKKGKGIVDVNKLTTSELNARLKNL